MKTFISLKHADTVYGEPKTFGKVAAGVWLDRVKYPNQTAMYRQGDDIFYFDAEYGDPPSTEGCDQATLERRAFPIGTIVVLIQE